MTIQAQLGTAAQEAVPVKVKYCLYARKSSESEEKQVLSIDSQIKEMLQLAEREGLDVITMKRESHSAKEIGQRPIFNEIVEEIRESKYNGILTWAQDRISRNAGDLGRIVDLMEEHLMRYCLRKCQMSLIRTETRGFELYKFSIPFGQISSAIAS